MSQPSQQLCRPSPPWQQGWPGSCRAGCGPGDSSLTIWTWVLVQRCPCLATQLSVLLLSVTAKELYPQGNVVVPLAGVYPHIAGKKGGLQRIHHCPSVVLVCLENLERRDKSGVHSPLLV